MRTLKTIILTGIICIQSIALANEIQTEPASNKENIDFNLLNQIKTNNKEITVGQAADIIFSLHKANIDPN